jgi:hypothetical protein
MRKLVTEFLVCDLHTQGTSVNNKNSYKQKIL